MISAAQYFTNPTTGELKEHSPGQEALALDVLERREALRKEWEKATGKTRPICPNTGTEISGARNGTGGGGFREEDEGPTLHSSHKEAKAVDDADPKDELDTWLDQFEDGNGGNSMLEKHGLYREHPSATHTWCHLTTRRPASGHRTFYP